MAGVAIGPADRRVDPATDCSCGLRHYRRHIAFDCCLVFALLTGAIGCGKPIFGNLRDRRSEAIVSSGADRLFSGIGRNAVVRSATIFFEDPVSSARTNLACLSGLCDFDHTRTDPDGLGNRPSEEARAASLVGFSFCITNCHACRRGVLRVRRLPHADYVVVWHVEPHRPTRVPAPSAFSLAVALPNLGLPVTIEGRDNC